MNEFEKQFLEKYAVKLAEVPLEPVDDAKILAVYDAVREQNEALVKELATLPVLTMLFRIIADQGKEIGRLAQQASDDGWDRQNTREEIVRLRGPTQQGEL